MRPRLWRTPGALRLYREPTFTIGTPGWHNKHFYKFLRIVNVQAVRSSSALEQMQGNPSRTHSSSTIPCRD